VIVAALPVPPEVENTKGVPTLLISLTFLQLMLPIGSSQRRRKVRGSKAFEDPCIKKDVIVDTPPNIIT